MARRVITVARTVGAGGEETGSMIAKELGFRYADDEIISEAAERAGVSREAVEKVEQSPGLIARILDTMASVPLDPQVYYGQALAMPVAPGVRSGGYDELIQKVIIETANRGDVVIVAHGAGICLRGTPGVLRVLVTAPAELRAKRLAAGDMDEKTAAKTVENSDKERRDFLRRFYQVNEESPAHYDLVVNTDVLTVDQAADVIAGLARSLQRLGA